MTERSDPEPSLVLLREVAAYTAPSQPGVLLQPGELIARKFEVERFLGRGGMGSVYAVRHLGTGRRAALKILHQTGNEELVLRFKDEALAPGRVDSQHVVQVYDVDALPNGEPYLLMELLDGNSLGELLTKQGVLEPTLACELVAQAAEGVAAAHRAGIVHRDLKPDNLFVVQREGTPFVKILDFGIAKFTSESMARSLTAPNSCFGTPLYMAPEQLLSSKAVDARADVFALGVILFECLGGETPYAGQTPQQLLGRLLAGTSTPLSSLRPELDPELSALVHRAIAHDPGLRTPSAAALAQELTRFRARPAIVSLAEQHAATSAPPSLRRARRFKWLGAVVASAVMVLVLSAARAYVSRARTAAVPALPVHAGSSSKKPAPSTPPAEPELAGAAAPERTVIETPIEAQPVRPKSRARPADNSRPRPAPTNEPAPLTLIEENPYPP